MTGQSTIATSHRLAIGKEVYSEDGAMLGHVGHVGRDAFLVRKGFWFLKDSVLPRSTVVQVQGKRVLLAISRDEVRHLAVTPYDFGEDESNFEDEQVSAAPPVRRVTRETPPMRQTVNVIRNDTRASAPVPMPEFTDDATRAELRGGEYLTVPVIEEELEAHVRDVDAGRVRIVKTAVDEQATMQVPVRHEEVYVRQRAVYRPATAEDLARGERERVVDIPLHAQEVVTTKTAVVTGEVDVRKEVTEETEWVTDTVRREEVHVEEGRSGHVHMVSEGEGAQGMRGMRRTEQSASTLWEDESAFEDAPPVPRRTR